MRNKASEFIKYPLYPRQLSFFEKIMIKTTFGGFGKCTVCGSFSRFYVNGDNNLKDAGYGLYLRETCTCIKCGSSNRQRQIAYVAYQAVSSLTGKNLTSFKDFKDLDNFVVYNTEARGAMHDELSRMKNYICSEYFGSNHKSGEFVNNIMHQNLMNLSMNDRSIDLVISADVFEHIPDPYKAHEEVYRVLKTGGRHIFTVPFYQTEYLDEDRTIIDDNGNNVFLKEPLYHLDPIDPKGVLVYKIFSLEMLVKLQKIGFRTNMYLLNKPLNGIYGVNALVFEAIKEQ